MVSYLNSIVAGLIQKLPYRATLAVVPGAAEQLAKSAVHLQEYLGHYPLYINAIRTINCRNAFYALSAATTLSAAGAYFSGAKALREISTLGAFSTAAAAGLLFKVVKDIKVPPRLIRG